MKKYFSIITGVLIGVAIAAGMIVFKDDQVVYGGWWNDTASAVDTFSWGDVFGADKPKDLYLLVSYRLVDKPENDALKEVGQMYGLTVNEVDQVINGTISPIFNSPNRRSAILTQEDAFLMAENIIDDYNFLFEIYTLQQEVDMTVSPSEIFANGDTSDSGFDLIKDLSIIEEILFKEKSENTVGGPFPGALDSPYKPTDDDDKNANFVPDANSQGGGTSTVKVGLSFDDEADGSDGSDAKIKFGDGKSEGDVGVLDADVCPAPDDNVGLFSGHGQALNDGGDEEDAGGDASGPDDGGEGDNGANGGDEPPDGPDGPPDALVAAPADDWGKKWCPNVDSSGGSGSSGSFGDSGFSSLGGVTTSVIDQAVGGLTPAAAGINAYISLCLEIEFIKKKVTSYQPGDSCILCEVEKINDLMDETLHHSLVPNKATGNMMESAKCKDTGDLLSIQFIAIAAPIPTPPSDDVIFGNNIFNEWKRFVDRYEPFLGFNPSRDSTGEYEAEFAEEGTSQLDVYLNLKASKASKENKALEEIENYTKSQQGQDLILFIQKILAEIKLTNTFFSGYSDQYAKINEVFPYIEQKETK